MSNDGGSYCRRKKEEEEEEERMKKEGKEEEEEEMKEYRKAQDRDALEKELSEKTRKIVCQRAKAPRRA